MAAAQSIVEHTVPLGWTISSLGGVGGFVAFVVWRFSRITGRVKGLAKEVREVKDEVGELKKQGLILQSLVTEMKATNERLGRMQEDIRHVGDRFDAFVNACVDGPHNRRRDDAP